MSRCRMLKKASNFVLGSKKSSTYPVDTLPVFLRLRPRWQTFLSILFHLELVLMT